MKNLFLLCCLFFAFQNVLTAQGNFGITLGGGVYNQDVTADKNSKFTPQLKTGFDYQRNIINNRFKLSTSLNFHYFIGEKWADDNSVSTSESINGAWTGDDALLGSFSSSPPKNKSYFATSLPVILSVNWKKIGFGSGAEFQYRTVKNSNISLSYIANIQYSLSESFSIDVRFVRSLTDDNYFNFFQSITRTQRIEASLRYHLLKK